MLYKATSSDFFTFSLNDTILTTDSEQPTAEEPSGQGFVQTVMWTIGAIVLVAVMLILLTLVIVVARKCWKKKHKVHSSDNLWLIPLSESESETDVHKPPEEKQL